MYKTSFICNKNQDLQSQLRNLYLVQNYGRSVKITLESSSLFTLEDMKVISCT